MTPTDLEKLGREFGTSKYLHMHMRKTLSFLVKILHSFPSQSGKKTPHYLKRNAKVAYSRVKKGLKLGFSLHLHSHMHTRAQS